MDLWVSDVPFSISLFICDALLLYHITWLWLHFLVFGTDNGLHAVFFFLSMVLRLFPLSPSVFLTLFSRALA